MKVAYDLDGTIVKTIEPLWLKVLWKTVPQIAYNIAVARVGRPVIRPHKGSYIITGRSGRFKQQTIAWMKRYDIQAKLIMDTEHHATKQASREWKVKQIKRLAIDIYYENEQEVIDYLKQELPELRIIKYVA